MTEYDMEQTLLQLLFEAEDFDIDVERTVTFEDAGLLTMNRGLVLTAVDGSTFQVQIVRAS